MIKPKEAIYAVDFSDSNSPEGFWKVSYEPFFVAPVIADVFHYYFSGQQGSVMIEWRSASNVLYFIEASADVVCPTFIFRIKTIQCSREQFLDYLYQKNHPILDWFLFNHDLL